MREHMKVILVEDEMILLQGLRKMVDWEALGFTICETANNYLDAVSAAYLHKPDLIITDIMLGEGQQTGLALIEYLSALLPEMQSVLLTGYDRFEFAERAIAYSVRAYLLKPVSAAELTDCLDKIRASYLERQEALRQKRELDQQLVSAQPFLLDWLLTSAGSAQCNRVFGITGTERVWQAVVLSVSGSIQEQDAYAAFLELDFWRKERAPDIISFYRSGQLIYLLRSETTSTHALAEVLVTQLQRYCDFNDMEECVVGIGRQVTSLRQVQKSYEEAVLACRHTAFFHTGRCVYYADIALPNEHTVLGLAAQKEKLQMAVRSGHAAQASALLYQRLQMEAEQGASIATLRSMGIEALVILNEVAIENAISVITNLAWTEILQCDRLEQLCDVLKKYYLEVGSQLATRRAGYNQSVVDEVRQTIEREYYKNLTLESLAGMVYLSPAYLGSLFQRQFGKPFKDYLASVRMENAKVLLRSTDARVYEIAEKTGYTDSRYFSQVFKKYTGKTPLEYRATPRN